MAASDQRRLTQMAALYAKHPIDDVLCILFDTEEEAYHWVQLRHTGANDGAGLVEWDTNEQDRFRSRHGHGVKRKPAGQIIDFLDQTDGPADSDAKILTTLQRLVNTKAVRDKLGLEIKEGELRSRFPAKETVKGLRKIVGDLRSGTIKVKNVYDLEDRSRYMETFRKQDLPSPAQRLPEPIPLAELTNQAASQPRNQRAKPPKKPRVPATRTSVASSESTVNPGPPRLNAIYNELLSLNVDTYPNAGVVLLRVFLELSVDHRIDKDGLMSETDRAKLPLSKRLKTVADHLHKNKQISDQLQRAIANIADSQHTIAASAVTFNQYVHNKYVHPIPASVRTAWDELQPFLEQVWL